MSVDLRSSRTVSMFSNSALYYSGKFFLFFQSLPLYFVTPGSLMFIFMQPFLAHEFNHLFLSARTRMTLAFEPQQIFQVLAALSVYICKVTGCMCILRLHVFRLAFSAPRGMFQSQRNFRSFVKTPTSLLKANSQFMSAHRCCLDNNNCQDLKREQAAYLLSG